MDFVDFVKEEKKKTDDTLKMFFAEKTEKAAAVDEDLVLMLEKISTQFLRGGKRIRPLLTRLAYGLAGGEGDFELVKASLFLELTHSYILVHDDISDGDLKRYGGPTLEVEYGNFLREKHRKDNRRFGYSVAMVSGDLLATLAHEALNETNFPAERKVYAELLMAETFKQVAAGWFIHQQQNHEVLEQADEKRYLKGMELVSGSYSFESPLMIGLALAGQTKLEKALKKYAYHTGMAFQLKDDVLGVFGQTQLTGKPVGNDVREGKKTVLVLRAYKEADKFGKKFLDDTIGKDVSEEELDEVQNIIRETGAYDYTIDLAKDHVAKAKAVLDELKGENKEVLKRLSELAEFVVDRSS